MGLTGSSSAVAAADSPTAADLPTAAELQMTYLRFQAEQFAKHFNDPATSDVDFLVEGQHIYASKLVLTSTNKFFQAMLLGDGFKEGTVGSPIKITSVEALPS
eukprot:TRINITY_DN35098_c0_g1_i1.p1 TRINITY_DN35098_c0_g1~~TRINITY_DN35098_c0_g1_i1.p1  ORF type:complete len:103 (+),score=25.26 TRINITY_DN35098_c0_g1_i1:55-363(+)